MQYNAGPAQDLVFVSRILLRNNVLLQSQVTLNWVCYTVLQEKVDVESLERDNDRGIDSLGDRVNLLKQVCCADPVYCNRISHAFWHLRTSCIH